ncbi:MAG: UDP-N-acetylglucosamine--N-acetylmuramyl-(pentapeptide) pyrophosphoryl-undecaprenol N-acetylglucosamine transferase [Anaerolineales bacterium]|nr:UDP-N-acetylglucosamine--N-acetylmuramyl-(pentapeptide) pyrophosphoryl-undecaprenol N-acetylglucosamine transferase [Anaerolineales bacterium]HJO33710.1 UDP-N-acetylglucosamine--N-acetylmuramyl-(pentapeptide) pyrophosphoryl-undecaprenol N-acetylglucosamine transferase [Anaerolineales bacterium]
MRILICAAGTGGHVYPALAAVASLRAARAAARDLELLWVGSVGGMEVEMVREVGINMETILAGGVVGKGLSGGVLGLAKLAAGAVKALRVISRFRPEVIFVTGGYTTVPVTLAGWLQRKPMAVYLPDVQPGLAVRWAARISRRVLVTMAESVQYFNNANVIVTGYPLRPEIVRATRETREFAQEKLNLSSGRPTVLVVGGSRGARSINQATLVAGPEWIGDGAQVLHVSGQLDWSAVQEQRAKFSPETRAHYHVFPYLWEEMGLALCAADLVVARAGASCLGEFPAFGLPAVLVPYPHAWRYQRSNAEMLSEHGAAIWIEDKDLQWTLSPSVGELLRDSAQLAAMGRKAAALAVPEAAARVAAEIIAVAVGAG